MPSLESGAIVLVAITLFAAFVNGAIGYGFSSLTVPVGLLFYTNRLLNPALIVIELFLNAYVLFINRTSLLAMCVRVYPILIGLLPGVAAGGYFLASLHPGWTKFATYATLLPLILLQAAGVRRPIRSERLVGVPLGAGLGFLYSVSTISGPPLALLFKNQGLVKQEFRAAIGLIRMVESILAAVVYYSLGLFTIESLGLASIILPGVLVGIPLGASLIQRLQAGGFRRICTSFDIWVVGFGFSRVLIELGLARGAAAYVPLLAAVLADAILLLDFFRAKGPERTATAGPPEVAPPGVAVVAVPADTAEISGRSGQA